MKHNTAVKYLKKAGIVNPQRLPQLILRTIEYLELDLSGLTVLTEAASGPYVVTPVIATMAGAERVLAITQDSRYASRELVISQTRSLEHICNTSRPIEIYTKRTLDLFAMADIVTNLGFVRPLDREVITAMKPSAVIPLMCESWEIRPGDIDLIACRSKGIPVMGTNEDYPGLEIFAYSGWLCLKMLYDAQVELPKTQIMILSSDKFGDVIFEHLTRFGVKAYLIPSIEDVQQLADIDVLVIADYTRSNMIIGADGDITVDQLAQIAPFITIIHFAGLIDIDSIQACEFTIYPETEVVPHRMTRTLAELGPHPVIELHAAGLKVGELMWRERTLRQQAILVEKYLAQNMPLCQALPTL